MEIDKAARTVNLSTEMDEMIAAPAADALKLALDEGLDGGKVPLDWMLNHRTTSFGPSATESRCFIFRVGVIERREVRGDAQRAELMVAHRALDEDYLAMTEPPAKRALDRFIDGLAWGGSEPVNVTEQGVAHLTRNLEQMSKDPNLIWLLEKLSILAYRLEVEHSSPKSAAAVAAIAARAIPSLLAQQGQASGANVDRSQRIRAFLGQPPPATRVPTSTSETPSYKPWQRHKEFDPTDL